MPLIPDAQISAAYLEGLNKEELDDAAGEVVCCKTFVALVVFSVDETVCAEVVLGLIVEVIVELEALDKLCRREESSTSGSGFPNPTRTVTAKV